jgi:hypothetical protein
MPEISRSCGISIWMYRDEHLPSRVLGYVIEWAASHEDELARRWMPHVQTSRLKKSSR